ncbi:MAG: M20/M25/M40 family metallo-hydrolase [Anaerolineae bacterium]|nr:M20/M25/M40 family metallo-hydrolase [Anaerolineae bacterium]
MNIDQYLTQHLDQYLGEVSELCAQPSVSARGGDDMRKCANLVAQVLARHGLEVQLIETKGNPVVVGTAKGKSGRTLLCYNHYDVQPPEPLELWATPPFQPSIRDGALYARGSRDDKGELVARLAALDAVRAANGGALPCNVTFVVEGEEEIGSPNMVEFVQANTDLLRCDGAIWEEGGIEPSGAPYCSLGCRGILAVELAVQTMNTDAHSGRAHFLPSAAWRMVRVLESLKDAHEHILIDGFYDNAKPASELDLHYLSLLPNTEALDKQIYGLKEYVMGRSSAQVKEAVFLPTCNIEGIDTGYRGSGFKTVIPAKAVVKIDFRLVPDQEPDEIFAKLRAHLNAKGFADVQLTNLGAMSPAKTAADDPLVQLTMRTGAEVYGVPAIIYPMVGGSSPIYAFRNPLGGIPVISPGIGYWDNRAHAPNEHFRIADFLAATRHLARVMNGFANLSSSE